MERYESSDVTKSILVEYLAHHYGKEDLLKTAFHSLYEPTDIADFIKRYPLSPYNKYSNEELCAKIEEEINILKKRHALWKEIDQTVIEPAVENEFTIQKNSRPIGKKYKNIKPLLGHTLIKKLERNLFLNPNVTQEEDELRIHPIDEAVRRFDNIYHIGGFCFQLYDFYQKNHPFPSIKVRAEVFNIINRRLVQPIEYWQRGLKELRKNIAEKKIHDKSIPQNIEKSLEEIKKAILKTVEYIKNIIWPSS